MHIVFWEFAMALPVRKQLQWWGICLAVGMISLWYLGDVLLPFVAGSAVAYLLDPVADRLEKVGCTRFLATAIISVSALLAIVAAVVLLVPLLVQQFSELIALVPEFVRTLQAFLQKFAPNFMESESVLRHSLSGVGEVVKEYGGKVISGLFSSAMGAFNALMFVLVAPVVMVYMLADWDRAVAKVDSWLPRDHADSIRELVKEVDLALAGFIRGQLTVCAILACFYAILLMAVGLKFGLVVGCVAGVLSFIPFVGAIAGGALAIGLAVFQFWSEPWWIAIIAVIFLAGQVLEGNFLTPKLVGKSVGLHPVWLLFALSAFGSMFGFVGMLVAVPLAASLGVFFRFGVRQYLDSRLYLGLDHGRSE